MKSSCIHPIKTTKIEQAPSSPPGSVHEPAPELHFLGETAVPEMGDSSPRRGGDKITAKEPKC